MSGKPTPIIISHTDFEMDTKVVDSLHDLTEIGLLNYYLTNLNGMQKMVLRAHFY